MRKLLENSDITGGMLQYATLMTAHLVKQFCLSVVPIVILAALVYAPFLMERYDVLWASILLSTLSMPLWYRFGPRPSQGLWAGSLCMLGMLLLVPLFAFWAILGVTGLMD